MVGIDIQICFWQTGSPSEPKVIKNALHTIRTNYEVTLCHPPFIIDLPILKAKRN